MKKFLVLSFLVLFAATTVMAADFTPTPMRISAPSQVQYDYDGSALAIPVTISGTPSSTMLIINTKDKASSISHVQNGYLGWHYVNQIDTCIYTSDAKQLDIGSNTITWDGKDNDGNAVEKGDYTYYIWGFDNINFKIELTKSVHPKPWGKLALVTHDEDGTPKNNPYIIQSSGTGSKDTGELREQTNKKWIIGGDPNDADLLETCLTMGGSDRGETAIYPKDHSYIFKGGNDGTAVYRIYAWKWVPNGNAEIRTGWGEEGQFNYPIVTATGDWGPGVVSDGGDYLLAAKGDLLGGESEAEIVYVDVEDGSEVQRLDLSDWYVSLDDAENGGQASSGPANYSVWEGKLMTGAHGTCMNLMLDIYYEDEDEAVLWANDNGDYTGDHNFEEDSENPWLCNDYNVGPYKYNFPLDDKGFSCFTAFDMGAVSFGLFAPDGTGLGYHALSGETAQQKYDTEIIAYDSAFDGYMVSNQSTIPKENATDEDKARAVGYFWVGADTFQGIITSQVAVDDAPSAFAVAQNSPNPFNPNTAISFSIADAGNVSVDVFNVAGQKVDTIANEFMSAGSHTANWDASGFSAGVYFYTVKAGEFSKTMKMTLIK